MIYALDTNIIIHLSSHNLTIIANRDAALERGSQLIIPPYVNFEIPTSLIWNRIWLLLKEEGFFPLQRIF